MNHSVPTISLNILEHTHTLIGGTTGCGKSTLLHSVMYTGLACGNKWFIIIDPKMVELRRYAKCAGVIEYADTKVKAVHALETAVTLMKERQRKAARKRWSMYEGDEIYVVIDELADLMLDKAVNKRCAALLQELLQVARASRIHVIACTQSPSRQTIPAAIQVNFTCTCAMACKSAIESRQLINTNGCELLPLPVRGEADQTRLMYVSVAGRRDMTIYQVPYIAPSDLDMMIKARPRRFFQGMPA